MIQFEQFRLSNGLRVIHHHDADATAVILNILYNVGARDETEDKTGFAHLFEHLMFGGSIHIAEYDKQVERAGGSNNAYTNNDFTNYYITVPAENVETAFWLESDRMLQLDFSQKSLDVQRGVVLEEFKQRCFNAPFGMLWHHLRELLYTAHPYKWPTIGLKLEHIEKATLEDVEAFYYKHYHPANAILCVGGNISFEETKRLSEKWFGSIDRTGVVNENRYQTEPPQQQRRFMEARDLSPDAAVFMAWRGPKYSDPDSVAMELFSDMFGGTETSPLHVELVKKTGMFNAAECFYMRNLDDGVFILYGILNQGISHQQGENMLMDLMQRACKGEFLSDRKLTMAVNRNRSHLLFEHASLMNKAQKLCFYENLGDANGINEEAGQYANHSLSHILGLAAATYRAENASVLYYSPKK